MALASGAGGMRIVSGIFSTSHRTVGQVIFARRLTRTCAVSGKSPSHSLTARISHGRVVAVPSLWPRPGGVLQQHGLGVTHPPAAQPDASKLYFQGAKTNRAQDDSRLRAGFSTFVSAGIASQVQLCDARACEVGANDLHFVFSRRRRQSA